jgi:NADPH:quinone reductase-like Zn-dependent oxidoreductase
VLDEHDTLAPDSASAVQAATLPLNALTAGLALRLCELRDGQTLLVTGAAGGVGGFVLELAAMRRVRTVALRRHVRCRHTGVHRAGGTGVPC